MVTELKPMSVAVRAFVPASTRWRPKEMYTVEVTPDLLSKVASAVTALQSRPLRPMYPVVFFYAPRVNIREEGVVRNKAFYLANALQNGARPLAAADQYSARLPAKHPTCRVRKIGVVLKGDSVIFDKQRWEQFGKGFFVRDCTIGFEDGRLGFLFVAEGDADLRDDSWETRLVAVKLDLPVDKRFFVRAGDNMGVSRLSSAWLPDQSEFIMADTFRRVWSYKPKEYKGSEESIPFETHGHEYDCAISKVVRVGTTVFAVGAPFRIFERIKGQQWKEVSGIPIPAAFESRDEQKIVDAVGESIFFDLAGFSTQNMYAVGDVGTVWHYDGKRWEKMPFPSNVRLSTVACGENGEVYITDLRGNVWKGSGSNWCLVCEMNQSLPFADSAWFGGRLWCANDYGMYVLEGKKLVAAHTAKRDPIPNEVALHAHRIDVSPDGKQMLVCGGDGAALHDGKKWKVLFSGMSHLHPDKQV